MKDPGQEYIRVAARFTTDERVHAMPKATRWTAFSYLLALTGESRATRTDGTLPLPAARAVGRAMDVQPDKLLAEMAKPEVGLIEMDGKSISIIAYEKWQDSAEEIEENAAKRSESGRTAGLASGAARRKKKEEAERRPNEGRTNRSNDSERRPNESFERFTNENELEKRREREELLENNSETPRPRRSPPGSLHEPSPPPGEAAGENSDSGVDLVQREIADQSLSFRSEREIDRLRRILDWWASKAQLTGRTRPAAMRTGLAIVRLGLPEQDVMNELHRIWTERDGRDAEGCPIESLDYFWRPLNDLKHAEIRAGLAKPIQLGSILRNAMSETVH